MSGRGKKREGLIGRLLLSSALVAVSVAYGWWQRHNPAGPHIAAAPMNVPSANRLVPARSNSTVTARTEPPISAAIPAPQATAPSAAAPALPVTALAALRMYQPPPAQAPLPLVTGTPAPGATAAIPPGTHLEDGDYLSDMQQFEWGDLTVKISVRGGRITGVQLVQYPDHRAESLQLSQMASPILDSEVIQTQQAKVDIVSSATETSHVFRKAAASAIMKATRP